MQGCDPALPLSRAELPSHRLVWAPSHPRQAVQCRSPASPFWWHLGSGWECKSHLCQRCSGARAEELCACPESVLRPSRLHRLCPVCASCPQTRGSLGTSACIARGCFHRDSGVQCLGGNCMSAKPELFTTCSSQKRLLTWCQAASCPCSVVGTDCHPQGGPTPHPAPGSPTRWLWLQPGQKQKPQRLLRRRPEATGGSRGSRTQGQGQGAHSRHWAESRRARRPPRVRDLPLLLQTPHRPLP